MLLAVFVDSVTDVLVKTTNLYSGRCCRVCLKIEDVSIYIPAFI